MTKCNVCKQKIVDIADERTCRNCGKIVHDSTCYSIVYDCCNDCQKKKEQAEKNKRK